MNVLETENLVLNLKGVAVVELRFRNYGFNRGIMLKAAPVKDFERRLVRCSSCGKTPKNEIRF